jgi:hypothetical protein
MGNESVAAATYTFHIRLEATGNFGSLHQEQPHLAQERLQFARLFSEYPHSVLRKRKPHASERNLFSDFVHTQHRRTTNQKTCLGVIFSANLTFTVHYTNLLLSMSRTTNCIFRCFENRNRDFLKSLYVSFVRSKMEYCSII